MLCRWKHGHVHTDFRDNGDRGKQLDTRNGQEQFYLWTEWFGQCENDGFEIVLAQRDTVQMGVYYLEFLDLFLAHKTVNGGLYFIRQSFAAFINERCHIKIAIRVQEKLLRDSGGAFAEYIGEDVVELDV